VDAVVAKYPEIASKEEIGTSFEGRQLVVIKLSNGPDKPGIFFDSGIHACEWAGPPVSMFAINELTENLAVNQGMLDKVDFYFLPIANPDGYVYAHENVRKSNLFSHFPDFNLIY
jgi:murein tripeptide amidase MpaA